jgi:LysR family transcriptional regulator, low CO2-responsive transcriptional regulator
MIETRWLETFAAFAEDANLSRTARRLHLSQPAVHAQLKKLSEALGVTLYRRVGRGLVLTREGVEVSAFARELEERTEELALRLRDDEPGNRRIVLAAGAGALLYVLGDGLRAFSRTNVARVELMVADSGAALDAVRAGIAQVGVAALDDAPPDLDVARITEVEQVLVVPRAHPLARRRRISIADLAGQRLIVPPEGRPQRALLDAAARAAGVAFEIGAVARGWELTLKLVELEMGAAIVNACCRIPRGLVTRPLRALPRVRYAVFTRTRPRAVARGLVEALVGHGESWRTGPRVA